MHHVLTIEPPAEDFFNFTSGRWIYNEQRQLAARRIQFSVSALKSVAAESVGALECTKMIKLPEERYHRLFLLSFDNGSEVIARLPTSLAGPAHLTTASEVATMEFVRELGVPVPKVLAWSSRANTEVGAEYIIMEKAKGVPLSTLWHKMTQDQQASVLDELVDVDAKMLTFKFAGYGSIFFVKDMIDNIPSMSISADPHFSRRYRIGPSVGRPFYEAERGSMKIDRGPCMSYTNILI